MFVCVTRGETGNRATRGHRRQSMSEAKPDSPSSVDLAGGLESAKLQLERDRYRAEIVKWIIVAIGAAVSFAIIDYGKLRLEQARLASENQFKFIEAYTKAT